MILTHNSSGISSSGDLSVDHFQHHLEDLPPELYDKIYNDVFTADQSQRLITPEFRPPIQLQVSKATRAKFAQSYYSKSRFEVRVPRSDTITGPTDPGDVRNVFRTWIRSLEPRHLNLIEKVNVVPGSPFRSETDLHILKCWMYCAGYAFMSRNDALFAEFMARVEIVLGED